MQINDPATVAEVTAVFERYERALTGNDIAVLDELFWRDPHVVRLGAGENLYGYEEILAFRRQRPARGLERALQRTVITTFGTGFASATTEFTRAGEARIGRQSQTLVRLPEGWRIVAAHVSLMAG